MSQAHPRARATRQLKPAAKWACSFSTTRPALPAARVSLARTLAITGPTKASRCCSSPASCVKCSPGNYTHGHEEGGCHTRVAGVRI